MPWFCGKDVCEALSISNHKDALSRLDDDEKDGVGITDPMGRSQTATFINESGLYNLIFQSRKPEAKSFRKWVTSEVLPTLRSTGKYELKPVEQQKIAVPRIRRGELVNADLLQLLWLIGEYLHQGDQKDIALELGVSTTAVCNVINGKCRSNRILRALYLRALENRKNGRVTLYLEPERMRDELLSQSIQMKEQVMGGK
jgi:hypothetical protein